MSAVQGADTPLLGTVEEGVTRDETTDRKSAVSGPWRASLLSLGLLFALVGVVNFGTGAFFGKAPAANLIAAEEAGASAATSTGWYIYKVAFPGSNQSRAEYYNFMHEFAGSSLTQNVSLGCDGVKINTAWSNFDKQLHYVVAPRLESKAEDDDNMGIEGWIETKMNSFGDMKEFSPFMHDKIQLFVSSLTDYVERLTAKGYKFMLRKSRSTSGYAMGHVLVPVGGQIWEFVGLLSEVTSDDLSARFLAWSEEECPMAHQLPDVFSSSDVEVLVNTTGLHTSEWITVSSATSDVHSKGMTKLAHHLKTTGAVYEEHTSDYCTVVSVHYHNKDEMQMGGGKEGIKTVARFVQNNYYQKTKSGKSIADYENYITRVHERYLSNVAEWRGWDHWLDQHIGIKYAGIKLVGSEMNMGPDYEVMKDTYGNTSQVFAEAAKYNGMCHSKAEQLNALLKSDEVPVGKRFIKSDGDHYYSAYPDLSMTVEYNTECHLASFESGDTDICTCVPMNSDLWAVEHGVTGCSLQYEMDSNEDLGANGKTIFGWPLAN